ncbi:hypothetical protein ACVWYG_002513 [Pedobacter sp. UYEF25]
MSLKSILYRATVLIFLTIFGIACALKNKTEHFDNREISISGPTQVARVTGESLSSEHLPSPNDSPNRVDVFGTDLGIIWKMADKKIGLFFGDTNGQGFVPFNKGGGGNGGNWRSNVLAFSEDNNFSDGITISSWAVEKDGKAREIAAGGKANPSNYQTSIPTGAIHANGADYVHYMNIYDWNGPKGRWLTNFSSIYASYNGGKTWQRKEQLTFNKSSKFSQICYAKKDGYVYMIGTLAGRGSSASLARFKEKNIEKLHLYQYWNHDEKKWVTNDESAASDIFDGPIGEASLQYHEKYKRWILMYIYDFTHDKNPVVSDYAIVYRTSKEINGIWSGPKVLLTGKQYPGLYSPYMYPFKDDSDEIYFNMSLWGQYNVFLMKATVNVKKE